MQSENRLQQPQFSPLSWEGDRMFHVYIYDYCSKRGFKKTAQALMTEANLEFDHTPPIDARQGLLFEWWSVFWVLFQAKSNGMQNEDAMLYIQNQPATRTAPTPTPRNPIQVLPIPPPPTGPPGSQPQNRIPNGANGVGVPPMQGMPRAPPYIHNANGHPPPNMSAQPGQMNFAGMGAPGQPNGMIPGPPAQPGPGPLQPGTQTATPFNPTMTSVPRQANGMPQQGQLGRPAFQSPTMAHSPANSGGAGQPGQAPMAQLGGPSPSMMHRPGMQVGMQPVGMQPPNSGMNPPTPQGGGPPTPGYNPGGAGPSGMPQAGQAGRPPSRTNTPRNNGIMPQQSPSMGARQPPGIGVPGMPGQAGPSNLGQPGNMGGMMMSGGMMAGMGGGGMVQMSQDMVNQQFNAIPQQDLDQLRTDFGFGDKTLTMNDKARLLQLWRQRKAGPGHQQHQPRPGGPGQQQQPRKRNSTSPGDEHDTAPRNESSPPDRKRIRRSPAEGTSSMQPMNFQGQPGQPHPQPGPMPPQPPLTPQQQQQHAPLPNTGQAPLPRPMNQHGASPMGGQPGMGGQPMMRQPGPNNGIVPPGAMQSGGMPGQPPPPGQMQPMHGMNMGLLPPGMTPAMYRQPPQMGKMPGAPGGTPDHAFSPSSGPHPPAPSTGPQFSATPLTRLGQTKPGPGGPAMMPHPSPALNGPPGDGKDKPGQPMINGQPQPSQDGSPRNMGASSAPPTGSGLPTPGQAPPGLQPSGPQPPAPPQMPNLDMGVPSMDMSGDMFGGGFMGMNMDINLGSFDMFKPGGEGDFGFDQNFSPWLNDDPAGGLDSLK